MKMRWTRSTIWSWVVADSGPRWAISNQINESRSGCLCVVKWTRRGEVGIRSFVSLSIEDFRFSVPAWAHRERQKMLQNVSGFMAAQVLWKIFCRLLPFRLFGCKFYCGLHSETHFEGSNELVCCVPTSSRLDRVHSQPNIANIARQ